MKPFTLSTAVVLNALTLLTPSTEATPVKVMEATALLTPASVTTAKKYPAARTFLPWIGIRDGSHCLATDNDDPR
jgi:hypothetical protein